MHSSLLLSVMAQGALAQINAFNQLDGSRTSVIIDETARAKYLFPPSRGSSNLVSDVSPCQGYEVAGRIDYPISGGVISWATLVDIENVKIRYSTSEDPTSLEDFQDALTNVTGGWRGQQCIDGPNFAALGLSTGDQITMQLAWQAGKDLTDQYECADLTLVSANDFEEQNLDTSCVNFVQTTKQRRDDVSNPPLVELRAAAEAKALAEAESSEGSNGLTTPVAGVIGAMTTLGVVGFLLAAAWWTGVVAFGRYAARSFDSRRPSISSTDKIPGSV